MKKIRFGITGSGYMGRTHAEAIKHLSSVAELVAIWGGTRAAGLAQKLGAVCEPTLESLVARRKISRSDAGLYGRSHDEKRRRPYQD